MTKGYIFGGTAAVSEEIEEWLTDKPILCFQLKADPDDPDMANAMPGLKAGRIEKGSQRLLEFLRTGKTHLGIHSSRFADDLPHAIILRKDF